VQVNSINSKLFQMRCGMQLSNIFVLKKVAKKKISCCPVDIGVSKKVVTKKTKRQYNVMNPSNLIHDFKTALDTPIFIDI
jgi:hypothetical protein